MGRARPVPVLPPQPKGEPAPLLAEDVVLIVPSFPSFSPAAIAELLKVYRSTVHYWLANGKLDSFTDNIGARYVLREELVRFIRDYLKREVQS